MQFDRSSGRSSLDAYVEQLRAKLPAAPEGLIEGYVRWAPWVAIVIGALGVLVFLIVTALVSVALPFLVLAGMGLHAGGLALLTAILGLVVSAAEIAGGALMLTRRQTGWWILAFGLVIALVADLLGAALFSLALTLLVAYVHVEARPQYH